METLAAIIILAIISLFVFNIIVSSQEQQKDQMKEQENLYDLTYSLKLVSKDFRMTTFTTIDSSNSKWTFEKNNTPFASYVYDNVKKELTRTTYPSPDKPMSQVIATKIIEFKIERNEKDNSVIVEIENKHNQSIENEYYYRE